MVVSENCNITPCPRPISISHPFSPICCADVQLASSPDHQRYPRLPSSAASSRSSVSSSPGKKRQHQPHPNAAATGSCSRYPQATAAANTAGGGVGPTPQIPGATLTLASSRYPQQHAQSNSTGSSSEYYSHYSYRKQLHQQQHEKHTRSNDNSDTRHRCSSLPENTRNFKNSEAVSRESPPEVPSPTTVGTAAAGLTSSSVSGKNSDDSEHDMISPPAGRSESSRAVSDGDVASTGRDGTVKNGAECKRENIEKPWNDNRCTGGGPRGFILPPRRRGGTVGGRGTMSGSGSGGDRTSQMHQRPQQQLRTTVRGGGGEGGRSRGFDAAPYETTVLFRDR